MTTPAVVDITAAGDATAAVSRDVSLPGSLAVGQRLIIFVAKGDDGGISFPGTWTELTEEVQSGQASLACAWRDVDGTEGSTVTVTSGGGSSKLAWAIVRIGAGTFETTQAPTWTTAEQGSTTTPNPPSHTGFAGLQLWIAVCGAGGVPARTFSVFPYADNQTQAAGSGGGNEGYLGLCTNGTEASPEDPGTFTISSADNTNVGTLSVKGPKISGVAAQALAGLSQTATATMQPAPNRQFGNIETAFVKSYNGKVITGDGPHPAGFGSYDLGLPTRAEILARRKAEAAAARKRWPAWHDPVRFK